MPDDISRAQLTQMSHNLDLLHTYLQKKISANDRDEKARRQLILDSLDDVQDQIKVMMRLILEKLFDNIFAKGRKEIAPKLVGICNALKRFGAVGVINIILTELFEKIS